MADRSNAAEPQLVATPVAMRGPGLVNRSVRRFTMSSFIRSNVILLVANLLTGLSAYLFHPVVGHLLGPVNYGRVAALVALSNVLLIPTPIIITVMSKQAVSLVAQGKLAELNGMLRRLTFVLFAVGVGFSAAFIALRGSVASFLKLPSATAAALLGLLLLVSYVMNLNQGAIQGLQRFSWYAGLQLASMLLRVALAGALVLIGWGVNGAVLAISLSLAITYLLSLVPLRQTLGTHRASPGPLSPLLRYSLVASLAMGGTVLLTNVDTILAEHFLSAHDAGTYNALAVMGRIVLFVSGSVTVYLFPKASAMHERGESPRRLLVQSLLAVALLSSSALALFLLFPGTIVRVMFGPTYAAVASLLFWYGLAMLFLALASTLVYYHLSLGAKGFVPLLLGCCVLQVVLITLWHQDPGAIVGAMLVVMLTLLVGMFVPLAWRGPARRPVA